MPLILGTNSIKDTGYTVANSCRFNDDDSAYISKTPASDGNRKTWTFSAWVKRGGLGEGRILSTWITAETKDGTIHLYPDGELLVVDYNGSGYITNLKTNRLFRDTSAWYHIVVASDTTQAVAANRVKIYVNGVQETSFATETYPAQDTDWTGINEDVAFVIGRKGNADTQYFDGYLAEVVFIDGLALAPTSFGEFDEDSPTIWKPINVSGLTFGTNGFYLDFEDSANLGNDANGGTDFTESNLAATDQATDTPTNNFATLNSLQTVGTAPTLSEGNLKITIGSTNWTQRTSTIAVNSGKWYAECKIKNLSSTYAAFGVIGQEDLETERDAYPHGAEQGMSFTIDYRSGQSTIEGNGSAALSNEVDLANDDILGIAMDLDNGKLYWHKNGTYINSGSPTSGSTGTGAVNVPTAGIYYYITYAVYNGSILDANFGNSIDAISSGNADANGYGNFEYSVPSGYYALCTKNLAEFG